MTKSELLKKLQEIYEQADELDVIIRNLKETSNSIRSLIEDIPDEADEIVDDQEQG